MHQVRFLKPHFRVLDELSKKSALHAFLGKNEFEGLCSLHGVKKGGKLNRDWLLDLLDKLGVIVHFPRIPWLDSYVLNPRWLTYGVYTILYSKTAKKQTGVLSGKDVIDILQKETVHDNLGTKLSYTPDKCKFILDAMEQFELCYRLPADSTTYIFPDLLSSDRPKDLSFDKEKAMSFDFDFEGILPRNIISNFIVRRNEEILNDIVWQNGVRLHSKNWNAHALVSADYHARRLSLWVNGIEAGRYFSSLYDEMKKILQRLSTLSYKEWVVLKGNSPTRANFRDLLALEAAGESKFTCENGIFNLNDALKIMPENRRRDQAREIKLSINNSLIIGSEIGVGEIGGRNAEYTKLREKLLEIQRAFEDSALAKEIKEEAIDRVEMLAEAKESKKPDRQNVIDKSIGYLNGLASVIKDGKVVKDVIEQVYTMLIS